MGGGFVEHREPKRNNKGFSLVELLVAVAILGIIVAPLLHTFVTSSFTAAKSKELGNQNSTAQNVAEAVQNTLLSDLSSLGAVSAYDSSGTLLGNAATDSAAEYDISMSHDELVGNGLVSGNYRAQVKLVQTCAQNSTQYTPMDAVFTQEGNNLPGGDNELDPDTAAQKQFESEASTVTSNPVSYDIIRSIDLDIGEMAADSYEYSCKFTYKCSISYTGDDGRPAGTDLTPYENSYTFFNGTRSGSTLAPIYFCYFPSSGSSPKDTITITRTIEKAGMTAPTPVSVFLAQQDDLPPAYRLTVQVKGDDPDSQKTKTRIYSNGPSTVLQIFKGEDHVWYQTFAESFGKPFGNLYDTQQQYRRYLVTIDLYDSGNNKVYTLITSKVI